ncbi:MAG TPA: RagB/SusD family nutrient uptake outer membrane protein [Bacteroidales bacterium]|nr:RagB/SusD family nutrient uptake outer membrane protein [Bacteroidales bacterium]HQJ81193.1 RagB/SusD family nutrient uptake outer membrane protein [Bacteroidales bacterium]
MKKRFFSLFILAGLLVSCSEDYLNRTPLDEISPGDFFRTANDLRLYANRFYPLLPSHSGHGGGTFWTDDNSDNLVPGTEDKRLAGTRTVPSSGGGWNWEHIRQVNYFLDHCFLDPDEADLKRTYIAEVRLFKAMIYFDMLRTFGDVPWFTRALNPDSPELYSGRLSREIVADSIIALTDYAIENLKPAGQSEEFRLNREVAILFKARVCLYEGTWEKYHQGTPFGVQGSDGTRFLQMAEEAAALLMQSGTLNLYKGPEGKEYSSLFNKLDYSGIPEVLLWKKYDIGLGIYHWCSQYLPFGAGNTGVSKSLMDAYLCTDGKPISVSPLFRGYDSIQAESADRDPRLAQSMLLPGDDVTINSPGGSLDKKWWAPALDQSQIFRATTGYCMNKGANLDYSQQQSSGGIMGSIIFRYTEALLIYAEARAELGIITQDDIDKTVNKIRDRVGMIHLDINNITIDPAWDFPELSPLINEIRRERRVELAFEAQRWDDLARWRAHRLLAGKRPRGIKYIGSNLEGTYKDYLGKPTIVIGQNLFVDSEGRVDPYQVKFPNGLGFNPERDYLSPIPSDELTLNNKLIQNPGW